MTQGNLFAGAPSMPVAMRKRLSRQCRLILELLQKGPASNAQLTGIALRYSARIFELREAGYRIRLVSHDCGTGVTVYELEK